MFVMILLFLFILKKGPQDKIIDTSPFLDENGRLLVSTTLFPVYDFAKVVGGDKANVFLLLPAGSEAHAYLPTEIDKERIAKSALFFYTSSLVEPWAPEFSETLTPKTKILAVADNLNDADLDPHVWLDFSKASLMVDNITAAYKTVDPKNSDYYDRNASDYKQKLLKLDNDYLAGLKDCEFREFISSGHHAFGYLAQKYNLKYQSAQGLVPDANLDTEKVLSLSKELKDTKQPYVYYEELIMPYIGELMRQSSGANLMPLNAAHNVGAYDVESGVTFISLMEGDLKILRKGLICR